MDFEIDSGNPECLYRCAIQHNNLFGYPNLYGSRDRGAGSVHRTTPSERTGFRVPEAKPGSEHPVLWLIPSIVQYYAHDMLACCFKHDHPELFGTIEQ